MQEKKTGEDFPISALKWPATVPSRRASYLTELHYVLEIRTALPQK